MMGSEFEMDIMTTSAQKGEDKTPTFIFLAISFSGY